MADDRSGFGQRAKGMVEQAKQTVGAGETPLATKVGGRAEAMEDALKAFGEGDIDRFLNAFADDVTWSGPKGENFPGAGNHDGRDAVRDAFIGDAKRSFASFGFRPDRFLGAPDADIVVAVGAFIGEGLKGSQGQLDAPAVQVWEFDGDEVVAVDIYTDSDAFPGVVTEQEEQEREKEDDGEGEGKAGSDDDGKAESKGDGEDDAEGESKTEGKADSDGGGKAESTGEGRDDAAGESESKGGDDAAARAASESEGGDDAKGEGDRGA